MIFSESKFNLFKVYVFLIPQDENKTITTIESNFKQALIQFWSGWWILARSIAGFPENGCKSYFAKASILQTHKAIIFPIRYCDIFPSCLPSTYIQSGASIHPDIILAQEPPTYLWFSTSGAFESNLFRGMKPVTYYLP